MIQRIQSFYLLIVTGLLITAMCLPMGYFIDTTGEHPFKALGIDVNGIFQSTWGIFGILMLSALVAFATIFLYKNRMLQIRMSIFNSLLLVGYYIAFIAFYFAFEERCQSVPYWLGALLTIGVYRSECAGYSCYRT